MIDYEVNAFRGLHGKALVAQMIDVEALKSIYLILNDICPGLGRVQYLGGLSVLISFEDNNVASLVLEAAREVIGRFSSIDLWEGQTFGYDRLAWLKLTGIPLHLISREVIDAVGSSFGRIVHRALRSESDDDLSYDYIGVLVGDGKRIGETITLVWREKKFNIWVAEEAGDWVPEFYKVTTSTSDPVTVPENLDEVVVNTATKEGEGASATIDGSPETVSNSGSESPVADVEADNLGIFLILKIIFILMLISLTLGMF
ncbi:hypothetical protein HanPI659440_Chr05g0193131 [Helianthus annuus]|nr:hypothetical protein HanPI659440_Chr05g0193131 [Helianthus annuus]